MTSFRPTTDPSTPGEPASGAASSPQPPPSASSSASHSARCSIATTADGTPLRDSVPQPRGRWDAEVAEVLGAVAQAAPESGLIPAPRPVREQPRGFVALRPSPSRRLRRMHPPTAPAAIAPTGQGAAERETAVPGPVDATGAAGGIGATEAGPGQGDAQLGVLIGGGRGPAEAVGRPEERAPVRVPARPLRIGRGTSLIVLPTWRPAIAVSVPTEHLLSATGLGFEQLAGARLTALMNPAALHDRELELHGWECVPPVRARRGGRV
ncbi:hypothetical protein [Kitasatospora sp. NPDC101183]|uniref:hypothetical protein n=1 Tax=Kitasatospora sp. NPDC101183 TaxID=3364100 RepID=UPI0038217D2B